MCIARLIKHSLYQSVLVRAFRTLWVYYMVDKEYFVLSRRLRTFRLHDTTDWGFIGCIPRWIKNTLYHTKDWEHLNALNGRLRTLVCITQGTEKCFDCITWEIKATLYYAGDLEHFDSITRGNASYCSRDEKHFDCLTVLLMWLLNTLTALRRTENTSVRINKTDNPTKMDTSDHDHHTQISHKLWHYITIYRHPH